MLRRLVFVILLIAVTAILVPVPGKAQDVPGIEICTVDKTMERRTSCLQSNVNFLVVMINKLATDHQQKIDAANRQIDALKLTITGLQKSVEDLQAAQKKPTPPVASTTKESGKQTP